MHTTATPQPAVITYDDIAKLDLPLGLITAAERTSATPLAPGVGAK